MRAAAVPVAEPSSGAHVVEAVRTAADATGVSFQYLLAQAAQESSLRPDAASHRSSARGLFQFTASTWLDMVKRHGAAHGLDKYAAAITRGADGRLHVADRQMRHAILELRRDPEISARMAGELAKDNQRTLEQRLGRPVSARDLTLAHFLGAGGAAKVLAHMDAAPKGSAARLLPEAARANPEVFHEPGGGRWRSVASLYQTVQARYDRAVAQNPAPSPPPPPAVELAEAPEPAQPLADAAPAIVQTSSAPASPFANAVDSASPFFPVAIPPAG